MDLQKIKQIDIFKVLTKKELEDFLLFTQIRKLKSKEILFKEGEEANALYVVIEGLFQVIKGKDVLGKVEKGGLIGEMAIFKKKHERIASVIALLDSELLVISSYAIEKILKEHKEIYKKIEKIIRERQKENKI